MKEWALRRAYDLYRWRWRILRPVTLGVRMLLVADGQVVLVKHTYQDGWHLPGGALNRGETPEAGALREAREEAGAAVLEPPLLLGVYSSFDTGQSNHVLTYVSRAFRLETPTDRWEIAQRGSFSVRQLPHDTTEGTRRRIKELLAGQGPYSGRW
jgi:ADP-ribose pyrophosphatase YjhB (NUDIX family)